MKKHAEKKTFATPMSTGVCVRDSSQIMQGRMEIREACQFRWSDILSRYGVDERVMNRRNQSCPFCGGTDRFRYTDRYGGGEWICNQCCEPGNGDGFEFLMRLTGKPFKEIASELREILVHTEARPAAQTDVQKARAALNKLWGECVALSQGDPVHRYLYGRGVRVTFSELSGIKLHPELPYWDTSEAEPYLVGKFPAMIGLITDVAGEPATVHCTYLTAKGEKAALDKPKKIKSPVRPYTGGAVRLMMPTQGQPLCVAEGIETALAMKTLYPELCPWAVVSAGNMEAFEPPQGSEAIYIAGDNDASFTGHKAAYTLANRLWRKKMQVSVVMPPSAGTDMADVLVASMSEQAA